MRALCCSVPGSCHRLWGTHAAIRPEGAAEASFPLWLWEAQGCFQALPGWAESLPCSKLGLPRYLAPRLESAGLELSSIRRASLMQA